MARFLNTILNFIALFIIILLAVDTFYSIVRERFRPAGVTRAVMSLSPGPERGQKPLLKDYKLIIDRNIFGIQKQETRVLSKPEKNEPIKPTTLNLALLGTVAGDPRNAIAVIQDLTKKQDEKCYKIGDTVQGAVIKDISRGRVVLRLGGKDEVLIMKESAGVEKTGKSSPGFFLAKETNREIRRSDLEKSFKNIQKLMSQVRIRPYFRGGRPNGLSISRIKPGSMLDQMGLKNGDIIQEVDGRPLTGADDLITLYENMKSKSRISLGIERRGKQRTINFIIR